MGGGAVGPDNGPGAGGMAVGRMAARAAEAKNGGRRDSRCPKGAGEEGGGNAAAPGARPRGRGWASRFPPVPSQDSYPRQRRRKFFKNCPCIAVRVPV